MLRSAVLVAALLVASCSVRAQMLTPEPATSAPQPLTSPSTTPGELELLQLEAKFAADTAQGGGAAFSRWFADDGIELPDGKAPLIGHTAIASHTQWDPKQYQLSWTPDGARIGPSGDSGFTWGHYTGRSHDASGQPVLREGRYITVWKKVNGQWKVALDASANDAAADCCALPKP
ncbi:MAG: nuclear transport factor 2 family protein [Acidobacteriaceae bacterium]|nr:nuclear transport factor 2 family protein [Acidobacteriaceae bacterium]